MPRTSASIRVGRPFASSLEIHGWDFSSAVTSESSPDREDEDEEWVDEGEEVVVVREGEREGVRLVPVDGDVDGEDAEDVFGDGDESEDADEGCGGP